MKGLKFYALALSAGMLMSGCGGMNNTGKGSLIGAGGGAALGTLVGTLVSGNKGKGAAIGAAVGVAVGTTAGALIGKRMDKAKAAAQQVENAQVETVTDVNGLQAVKVTFDSGILFNTSSSALSSNATASLAKFASTVLNPNKDMNVDIKGYTDNTGSASLNKKRLTAYGFRQSGGKSLLSYRRHDILRARADAELRTPDANARADIIACAAAPPRPVGVFVDTLRNP